MTIDMREFRRSLRRIERRVVSQLKAHTACCGVTAAQCHVLLELEDVGQTALGGLADRLRLDASTLSRTVEGLVRAGMVYRETSPHDRRSVVLRLTPLGTEKTESINQLCDEFYRAVLDGIHPDRHESLAEAIETVAGILSEVRASETHLPRTTDSCACTER